MRTQFISYSIVLFLSIFNSTQAYSQKSKDSSNPKYIEVKVPMEDGVLLATDIYFPKKQGKFPVVLVRTPYNKSVEQWMGKMFGFFGIAVVVQDCRGKFKSEGEFYPFINERADGLSTLKWIRQQPWFGGTIAGWGSSYVGYTQWAISDSLDFLTLFLTGANLYDFTYPDGSFSLQSAFVWGFQNASQDLNSIPADTLMESLMILPLSAADDSTITEIPFITDWLQHEKYDSYWENLNFRGKSSAPMISLTGWYDIFLKAGIDDFQAAVENGDTESRLIIGPWCHGSQGEGNLYGGPKKTGKPQKVFIYVKNFLKGRKNKLTKPLKNNRYNLFIMERNEYTGSDVWPPEETTIIPYYLGPSDYLSNEKYSVNGVLDYKYSPANPFPGKGGTALGDSVGPARQNNSLDREDQLSFETDVKVEPLILCGPVSATLWLTSDVRCTDFVVELQDVFPDGKVINIQEGIAKVEINGDKPQKTEISVWATGYQLNPGHSLRVIITSSWFPRFNRNLNNCDPILNAVEIRDANQKLFFGPDYPSSINLPVYTFRKK